MYTHIYKYDICIYIYVYDIYIYIYDMYIYTHFHNVHLPVPRKARDSEVCGVMPLQHVRQQSVESCHAKVIGQVPDREPRF